MKTLDQFKTENAAWLEDVISDYAAEMEWNEGMNTHPSDYFTDTLFVAREKCKDEDLAIKVKEYIEGEVINRLRGVNYGKTN